MYSGISCVVLLIRLNRMDGQLNCWMEVNPAEILLLKSLVKSMLCCLVNEINLDNNSERIYKLASLAGQ